MAQAPAKPIAEIQFYRWTAAASGVYFPHTQAMTRGVSQRKDGAGPSDENNWGNLMPTSRVTQRNVCPCAVFSSRMVVGLQAQGTLLMRVVGSKKNTYLVAADVPIPAHT